MSGSSRVARSRFLVTALVVVMALPACSSTNDKKLSADPGASAIPTTASSPTPAALKDANGKALTKQQIIAAVKAGTLPKSALNSAAFASPAPRSGGGSTVSSAKPRGTASQGLFPGAKGPGFTATQIKVGLSLFKVGSVGEQFGIKASYGDGEKQAQAVVDYVNAHGGIAGRKVAPVYYTVDFGRAGSIQDGQFEAEACAKWTQDDRVFFALNNAMSRQALLTCLGKAGVPAEHDGMNIDERRLNPYRNYYYSGTGAPTLTIDRSATTRVKVLGARGFFKNQSAVKPTVVGIEYYDDEYYKSVVENEMVPLIKSFGVKKVVLQAAGRGATTPDATYVSRFQSEGVTNVFFVGEANAYPLTFMPAAENQQYFPKYGLTTDQSPAFLEATPAIPRNQLANSMGVGWSPLVDVNGPADPGPAGPNEKLCLDIEIKAGQDMSARGARLTASTYCNALFFLKQNLEQAPSLSVAGLAQAVAGLGDGFDNVGIFNPSSYTSLKHDGADTYRDLSFVNGAFAYTSKNKPMPR